MSSHDTPPRRDVAVSFHTTDPRMSSLIVRRRIADDITHVVLHDQERPRTLLGVLPVRFLKNDEK